ncbi:MAG: rhomboid family intramembrane serine protease [Deltaproteobacteria bacterium]|nr:MAG: rhomboid family intramembrane serine protease [Deltaproteobacteria bacterium]
MTRNQRSSILCPNCKKLISADEPRCPHCGIARPGSRLKNNPFTRLFVSTDQIVKAIVLVNVGMYIISLLLGPWSSGFSMNPLSLLSPSNRSLLLLGATGTVPIDRLHRWWTLISANYLHAGLLHILFNMIALRQIAPLVIREFGPHRMVILYLLSGIIGFLVSYLAGVELTIGASAAVCGLIGASLYYGKSRGGIYGQTIYRQIGAWALGIFIFGLLVPSINNWGHGGGMVAGAMLGFMLGYEERRRERLFHRILAGFCVVATLLILLWAIGSGIYFRFLA